MSKIAQPPKIIFSAPPFTGEELRVQGIGLHEIMPPGMINRPSGTGDWLIMFFYSAVRAGGKGWESELPEGGLVIWQPGERQFYGNNRKKYKHSWLHCDGATVHQLIRRHRIRAGIQSHENQPEDIEDLVRNLYRECLQPKPQQEIAALQLDIFLCQTARSNNALSTQPQAPSFLLRLKQQIDAQPQESLTLEQMAQSVNMSRSHLCVLFKQYFDRPPIDYQIAQRLNMACYLLLDRNLPVNEIGRRCGYEDCYYFSKLFKKHIGLPPLSYRRKKLSTPAQ